MVVNGSPELRGNSLLDYLSRSQLQLRVAQTNCAPCLLSRGSRLIMEVNHLYNRRSYSDGRSLLVELSAVLTASRLLPEHGD
jgi:hypothetical protein